jgi:hypothetical protein
MIALIDEQTRRLGDAPELGPYYFIRQLRGVGFFDIDKLEREIRGCMRLARPFQEALALCRSPILPRSTMHSLGASA